MSSHVEALNDPNRLDGSEGPGRSPARRLAPWLGLLGVVFAAAISSNAFGVRDGLFGTATPKATAPAAGRVAGGAPRDRATSPPAADTSLRSQPWWQDVTTLDGVATTTAAAFTISSSAIQWRAQWSCQTGHLLARGPNRAKPVVDSACPQRAESYGSRTGPITLQVTADGPWHLQIAQQLDAPLVEPPLPAMTAPGASAVASGEFYNIDKVGSGKATLYRQPDGRYALRLDDFFVSPSADLQLRLSTLAAPHGSQEFSNAPSELVVTMDVTAGSFNYPVPAGLDASKFRSVVVWCAPVSSAYAAATLGPVR